MARYIDADKLLEYLEKGAENEDVKYSFIGAGVQATINEIKKFPLEDVKPVVHAHWEEQVYGGGKLFFRCSECGHWFTPAHGHTYNYCFCCGAKMDEGQ